MEDKKAVEKLEKIIGQLGGLHAEVSLLAKKSPNDAINAFKLTLINKIVASANDVLGPSYLPFEGFDGFDPDDLPSTSDVALVIAQYMEEAERYRSDNVRYEHGTWYYVVNGGITDIRSGPPSKVGRK